MQLTRLRVALQTPDTNTSTSVSDCGEAEHCHRNLYNWTKQVIPSIGYFEESFMLPNNVFGEMQLHFFVGQRKHIPNPARSVGYLFSLLIQYMFILFVIMIYIMHSQMCAVKNTMTVFSLGVRKCRAACQRAQQRRARPAAPRACSGNRAHC